MRDATVAAARARLSTWLAAGTILVATIWVYAPAIHGAWVWDDVIEVPQNPELRGPLSAIWTAPAMSDYLPVKTTLQWLEWHAWGGSTMPYHVVTLLLHFAAALTLWSILRQVGLKWGWLGALLFAVHPVAVESVAWIAEQKNTLSLLLGLAAFRLFLDFDDRGGKLAYLGAVALFLAAMLSKASVVMLPAVLLLHGWWRRGHISARDLVRSAPFATIAGVVAAVTIWFQWHRAIQSTSAPIGWVVRLERATATFGFYAAKALFPVRLSPVYEFSTLKVVAGVVATAALLGIWFWSWRKPPGHARTAGFVVGAFMLNLLPICGLVPMAFQRIAWVADHFTYISLVAVVGALAAIFELWSRRSRAAIVVAAAVALLWTGLARAHARWFANEETLWSRTRDANPSAWIAHANLGRLAANVGRLDAATASLRAAIALNPASADAWFNLANVARVRGQLDDAIADYERAAQLDPRRADVLNNLGNVRLQARDVSGALTAFRAAVDAAPNYAPAHANYGRALRLAGQMPDAETELETAVRLRPNDAPSFLELANLFADGGRTALAIENYRHALRLDPNNAEAHNNLGSVLAESGQLKDAVAEFETAVRLKPDYRAARENLTAARAQETASHRAD